MRLRHWSAMAAAATTLGLVAAFAFAGVAPRVASAAPGVTSAAKPKPKKPAPPVHDDGKRIWSVRPATATGGFDNRTHFTLQGTPGSFINDDIVVTNLSVVTVTFDVYGTDAFNTPTGAFDLLPASRKPVDLGSWIRFANPSVTIPAGKSELIPFRLVIPSTATPGDHAGGVVVSLASTSSRPGVDVDSRVAIRAYLRVPGNLRPTLAVGPVSVHYHGVGAPFGDGSVSLSYTVSNPGNIRLQSRPTITIKNVFGETLAKITPSDLPELLPNGRATFTATLAHVFPAGPLTATIALAPFPDPQQPVGQAVHSASDSAYVWAIPWTLLLIGLIVVVVLVGLWLVRRRRVLGRIDAAMTVARKDAFATSGSSR